MPVDNKTVFLYGISGLTVFALADPFPTAAVWLMVILIAGVVLVHSQEYAAMLGNLIGDTGSKKK